MKQKILDSKNGVVQNFWVNFNKIWHVVEKVKNGIFVCQKVRVEDYYGDKVLQTIVCVGKVSKARLVRVIDSGKILEKTNKNINREDKKVGHFRANVVIREV